MMATAAAGEAGVVGSEDFGDELMAGSAGEAVIAAEEFDVGVANAAADEAEEGVAGFPARGGPADQSELAGGDVDGVHLDWDLALRRRL